MSSQSWYVVLVAVVVVARGVELAVSERNRRWSLAQGGVSLKYNPGPLLLAGALTGGGASYETTRPMAFGGFTGVAEGNQDLGIFSAAFRAAYVLGSPGLYFKPILDASLTHLELDSFTESGGNGAALSIDGSGHTVFSLAPTLEAGTEWWLANGTLVRPLIRAGAIWYEGADFALTASFAGAPLGVSPFTINTTIDEVMGLVAARNSGIHGPRRQRARGKRQQDRDRSCLRDLRFLRDLRVDRGLRVDRARRDPRD